MALSWYVIDKILCPGDPFGIIKCDTAFRVYVVPEIHFLYIQKIMNNDLQDNPTGRMPDEGTKTEDSGPHLEEKPRSAAGNFREAAYVILFIAAVFVINAMETGSYRTPWPVALAAVAAGIGLFGYSLYLQSRSRAEK